MPQRLSQKTINALALPAIVSNLAEPLISLADTSIIGHIPENSTEAIGGIGVAVSLFFLLFWTFMVLRPAMVATVGKYVGEKREASLDPLLFQLVVFNAGLGVLIWALSSTFAPSLLQLYNAEGLVLENAIDYFRIRAVGLPLMLVTYLLFGVFQGLQNTRWAMYIALSGGIINLTMDLLLVYGVEGWIPPMGVRGAAYGALGSQVFMFVIASFVLLRHTPYRLRPNWKRHPELVGTLGVSGNFMIRVITINTVLFLANRTAAGLGEAPLAAHTMVIQIWTFSFFLLDGYSNAGQALSGKLFGQKDAFNLRFLLRRLQLIGLGISILMIAGYLLVYSYIGHLLSNDTEAVTAFEDIFWVMIVSLPTGAIAFTYDGILKGLADARFLRNMMLLALCVYSGWLFFSPDALTSVWWGFAAWLAFRSVWAAFYYNKKISRLESEWA